jgi:hypothetical protein
MPRAVHACGATLFYSRNRQIRAVSACQALRTTSFLAARSIGNRAGRATLRLSRLCVFRLRRYVILGMRAHEERAIKEQYLLGERAARPGGAGAICPSGKF